MGKDSNHHRSNAEEVDTEYRVHDYTSLRQPSIGSLFSNELTRPVLGVHPEIETSKVGGRHLNDERGPNETNNIVRPDLEIRPSPVSVNISQANDLEDPETTPKAFNFHFQDHPAKRPEMIRKRPLLSESISFMSTTSSFHSSAPPSPITKSDIFAMNDRQIHRDRQPWARAGFEDDLGNGPAQSSDSRNMATRGLSISLQALAEEQGGIPISALSSSSYRSFSASELVEPVQAPLLTVLGKNKPSNPASPWETSNSLPHPLGGHPTLHYNPIRRSVTLPSKTVKRATFLPMIEAPKSSLSFTRESVLSTPYPGSGFNVQRAATVGTTQRAAAINIKPKRRSSPSIQQITLIVRNCRNYSTAVGKIELNSLSSSPSMASARPDDQYLAHSILKEYRRLRGNRFLSARHLVGIRIIFKSHGRDFFPPVQSPDSSFKHFLNQEAGQLETSVASRHTASISNLEESLNSLIQKPTIGKTSYACREDLMRLISKASKLGQNHGSRGTIVLEIVEGWNWTKISIGVASVGLLAMVAMVLWVIFGVNGGTVLVVDGAGSVKSHLSPNGIEAFGYTRWRNAGSRVTAGAGLAILLLLLGWCGIVLWMGMSWLVN